MNIADSNAELAKRRAEAAKIATSAELVAAAEASKTGFDAQRTAEDARALKEEAALKATEVSRANVDKAKAIVAAEAIASVAIKEAEGRATALTTTAKAEGQATQVRLEGEAAGQKALLLGKADGFKELVKASSGENAISLIVAQQLTEITRITADAVGKIRIDKIVVTDAGSGSGPGVGKVVGDLFRSTIPLREIMTSLGIELPGLLGTKGKPDKSPDMTGPS